MAVVYAHVPVTVARMAGNHSTMDQVAKKLYTLARARAESHRLTGAYIASLGVENVPGKKGVRDRLVYADDKAAMSIEYGHSQRIRNAGHNDANFKWVPGQFILTGAIGAIRGNQYNSFGIIE